MSPQSGSGALPQARRRCCLCTTVMRRERPAAPSERRALSAQPIAAIRQVPVHPTELGSSKLRTQSAIAEAGCTYVCSAATRRLRNQLGGLWV